MAHRHGDSTVLCCATAARTTAPRANTGRAASGPREGGQQEEGETWQKNLETTIKAAASSAVTKGFAVTSCSRS